MIISVSGAPGSGKSTLAQRLADALGWPRYYMGGLRREAAARSGLSLAEYNRLGETDPITDYEVDEYQKELGRTQDNFVIEGRTSWFLIPHSLKIFLQVDEKEGARRIFSDLQHNSARNEADGLDSVETVLQSTKKRVESDTLRYNQYYGVDVLNPANFDLYLDTTGLSKEEAFAQVYEYVKKRLDKAEI